MVNNFDYDIGILGGGAAGLTIAAGSAQLGAKTLLIEKGRNLGGDCLHYGCVPSKTLIRTAKVYHLIKKAKEKPIGIQILGHRAGELISKWVAVMNGRIKLSTLASAVYPYPTLGEIIKKVVSTFFFEKIFSGKVKKVLKLFFNLKGRACRTE